MFWLKQRLLAPRCVGASVGRNETLEDALFTIYCHFTDKTETNRPINFHFLEQSAAEGVGNVKLRTDDGAG